MLSTARGEYFCAIRSRDMCHALHDLTGRTIYPLSGLPTPPLQPGDEALVYYVQLTDTVRSVTQMTREHMLKYFTLGLLTRVDGIASVGDGDEGAATEPSLDAVVQDDAAERWRERV